MSQHASRIPGSLNREGDQSSDRRSVLAPLDGTLPSMSALPVAKALAEVFNGVLDIVCVGQSVLPPQEVLKKLGLSEEQICGSIINHAAGTPAQAIVQFAEERQSSAIVICTHTGEEKPRGKLGSVAMGILYQSTIPVVLVHPERGLQPWSLRNVLFPHEGTPTTGATISFAAELTRRAGAELIVLHVTSAGRPRPVEPGTLTGPRYVDQSHHEWPAWAREFLTRAQEIGLVHAETKMRLLVATGDPPEAIARCAREKRADLIALAWRGHMEEERAAIIKSVVHESSCPVLILKVEGH